MFLGEAPRRIYLYAKPVDFRMGQDGLSALVQKITKIDAYSGAAFIFRARRPHLIKILVWDGSGHVLIYKKLETHNFKWPAIEDGLIKLSAVQFGALFDGIDFRKIHTVRKAKRPQIAA